MYSMIYTSWWSLFIRLTCTDPRRYYELYLMTRITISDLVIIPLQPGAGCVVEGLECRLYLYSPLKESLVNSFEELQEAHQVEIRIRDCCVS